MAEEIKEVFGAEIRYTEVSEPIGQFEIYVKDELIYSKDEEKGRYPDEGEIADRIRKKYPDLK